MSRLIFICFLLMTAWALQNCGRGEETNPLELRSRLWLQGLDGLEQSLAGLETACRGNASDSALRAAFHAARRSYKSVEFLFEYAFPGSAARLNGAAIDEVEPDYEHSVIPAAGLQVLEESVFPRRGGQPGEMAGLVAAMREVIREVRAATVFEPVGKSLYHRPLVWTDSSVLDAIRLELVRVGTLGITGFDSPVAKASLPEARTALSGMEAYLAATFPAAKPSLARPLQALREALAAATEAIAPGTQATAATEAVAPATGAAASTATAAADFDGFDRLRFLRDFLNPAYARLGEYQEAAGVPLPAEARAFSPASRDMFAAAWNPAYFGPAFSHNPQDTLAASRVSLGRRLFSDPVLSGDGTRSCATCHRPDQGFGDGMRRSPALGHRKPVTRNAPSLLHAAFQQGSFWDLRSESLEDQAFEVIHNPSEMGGSLDKAAVALAGDPGYASDFQTAFAGEPDADREAPVTSLRIRRSLAAYIRSLAPFDSPWDRYMRGEDGALSAEARHGFNLFMGKAACATCHFPPLFNGSVPPLYLSTDLEVLGVPAEKRVPGKPDILDPDSGRMAVDKLEISRGAFRTPTVRNAVHTAPYMHNGVFATLEEVVEFYDGGGGAGMGLAVPNQTLSADSLRFTAAEERALVAFMEALSDTAGTTAVAAPVPRYSAKP